MLPNQTIDQHFKVSHKRFSVMGQGTPGNLLEVMPMAFKAEVTPGPTSDPYLPNISSLKEVMDCLSLINLISVGSVCRGKE